MVAEDNMNGRARHLAHKHRRIIFTVVGIIFLSCCTPKVKVHVTPPTPTPQLENRATEAESFFKKGCYVGFKKAIEIYQELYAQPAIKSKQSPRQAAGH